ncbi:hypothetical protein GCM10027402_05000 [Arthrobacter monumenti]
MSSLSLAAVKLNHVITGELNSQVNGVWNPFWSGGISNPLEVIEQITYLLFLRRLDDKHTADENRANRFHPFPDRPRSGNSSGGVRRRALFPEWRVGDIVVLIQRLNLKARLQESTDNAQVRGIFGRG